MTMPLDRWANLRATAPALLLGLTLLGLVFWQEAAAAVSVWSSSTAYNHCYLVLPIAAWLVYDRRHWLPGISARPQPWIALAALPAAAAWLVAERLGIMEGRQLMAMVCVELLFLSVLGWPLAALLSAPLLYLFFLVPFGGFLTPFLQDFTANFIVRGLAILGIPNISDGNTIEIPEGVFFVAEACAGLRFLIASIAFGVLYSVTFYRSPGRRAAFIAASIVVPIIANGVRALGIVAAGHWVGSAEAAAADHLIYGWLFFSAVTLLLILAGLPFRQDGASPPRLAASSSGAAPGAFVMVLPAALLVIFAAAGPLAAGSLDREAASEPAAAPAMAAGCTQLDSAAGRDGAGTSPAGAVSRVFSCDGNDVQLMITAFPPRTNPNVILALQRSLDGQGEAEDTEFSSVRDAPGWTLVTTIHPAQITATALWLDGAPVSGGLRSRLAQARNSISGGDHPPILALARAARRTTLSQQREIITRYLSDATGGGPMSAQMAAASARSAAAR